MTQADYDSLPMMMRIGRDGFDNRFTIFYIGCGFSKAPSQNMIDVYWQSLKVYRGLIIQRLFEYYRGIGVERVPPVGKMCRWCDTSKAQFMQAIESVPNDSKVEDTKTEKPFYGKAMMHITREYLKGNKTYTQDGALTEAFELEVESYRLLLMENDKHDGGNE